MSETRQRMEIWAFGPRADLAGDKMSRKLPEPRLGQGQSQGRSRGSRPQSVITGLVPVIHLSSWENRVLIQGFEQFVLHLIGDFDQFGAGFIGVFSLFQLDNGAWKVVLPQH